MQEPKFKLGDTAWQADTTHIYKVVVTGVTQETTYAETKESYTVKHEARGACRSNLLLTRAEAIREFDRRRSEEFLKLFS